jgi:predicted TIM-barrel fold metal-dependent hydrolase
VTSSIDCLVHPLPARGDDLRAYLREPWKSKAMPGPTRYWYPNPVGEFHPVARSEHGLPGSDPATLARHVLAAGARTAILVPLTRGLLPDAEQGSAICAATNDWLAAEWLGRENGRYKGSIRVNPMDPAGAAREIERWAGHRDMVQVAVPLQVLHPYGQRMYLPMWEAAARASLPVMIYSDVSAGIELWPTAVGHPRHFIEHATMHPFNLYFHLVSFITEGVFDRLPAFRVAFGDPGFGMLHSIMWRLDKGWRSLQSDTPWAKRFPSEYIAQHVRFCSSRHDGPGDAAQLEDWLRINRADSLLLYGSNYPYWDYATVEETLSGVSDSALRERIAWRNAEDWYRLAQS